MKKPRISVIMSVYNGEKFLRESIESILNQSYSDFEFIIINDNSTDNTLEIIRHYDNGRIKLINNKKNIGLTKSLNKGLKVAKGIYVARQDADDISSLKRFEKQVNFLENNHDVVLLGSNAYEIDYSGKIINKILKFEKPRFKDLLNGNHFSHGSVIFNKEVICKLGGYNQFFKYVQDYELWLRISKSYKICNLKDFLYSVRTHSDSIRSKKIEEVQLYIYLAKKMASENISEKDLINVYKNGIFHLYSIFDEKETLDIQKTINKALANINMREGNLKNARNHYKTIYKMDPFDLYNYLNLIRSYMGKNFITLSSKAYQRFNNLFIKIKNN